MNTEDQLNNAKPFVIGTEKCPVCNSIATINIYTYETPPNEKIIIMTMKCENCGFKTSTIIPIATSFSNKCIAIEIATPQDLNTLIYVPEDSIIEISEINIKIEVSQLKFGNILTIDAILLYVLELLEQIASSENNMQNIKLLNEILNGNVNKKITIIIKSEYGVEVLKSHSNENYRVC
ncbi:hypothetical protein QPL79_00100 [Ignisphaera sp. 4213-co]|uniref:Zinc finger ZPR1-type domain-containing protein n=1 Tax=Ignisphaera cupida TaxID=3050454 RepID=A0ABD4Z390_9CREN|nr:hypothetical protein [Ignisphaera sp. 4213-co]MDK6027776.1 hypothetical protein [Ignisphaera sp. 4213-co]